ncbi:MAG TPA: multidrug efflux RND transporter permease subunit [Candidatus Polarisedimenticolia bacterium]|jgi:HAE1 family hydrophobic/amphiphilic exporter-1|nr:multidrug efflux RND transporter permease subunit [Candidatus Polarisedimenticolia bacterium]
MARFFVNRPIVAMVISIVTVLLGLVALTRVPVAQYPDIVPPMIQITTTYVGASAVDVEQSVATPIEQQVNGVDYSIYLKSINANDGTLTMRVSFEVGTDLDIANVLTQNRLSQATASLPTSVKNYGVTVKKSLAFPLMLVALTSPNGTYDSAFLSNYAAININDALARIRGVGQVNLFGGSDYAMRIWLNPDRLASLGLTVPDIVRAVQQQNVITPAGQIGGPPAPPGTDFTYIVKTQGRLMTVEEFGSIVLRTNPDGSQVRLGDVARTELGSLLYTARGRLNGKPSAVIAIYQAPGSNALQVSDAIKKTVAEAATRFPSDLGYQISLDTTLPVREGINEILHTLLEAVVLVLIVVFIFLQNWRATLIPLLTVPVSLVGTLMAFPMLGFSVNVLSLLGLVLAIGIVVDDAIVVVEAVMHHIEHGMNPKEATLKAMEEVSGPVVAIALILSAVFVPVAFISGITGRLYQQFAITIAISVLLSAFNALTLSPALSALLLKPKAESKSFLDPFYGWFNRMFDKFTAGYVGLTGFMVRRMVRSLILVLILIGLTVALARRIPGGFVPEEDEGYVMVNVQLPDAASLDRSDAVCKKVEAILGKTEEIASYTTVTGYSMLTSAYASNNAFFFVQLKEWHERHGAEGTSRGIMARLNREFATTIPEATVFAFGPPAIPGLGTGAGFTFVLQDRSGQSPQYLADEAQKFVAAASKRPEIGRVLTTYRASVPQVFAEVDRDKVLKQGVTLDDVNTTLGAFLGGSYVNDFNRFGRVYKVFVQAEPEYRVRPEDLSVFHVRNSQGKMVPLSSFVSTASASGPEYTNRFNLFRSADITGVPAAGYSSQQALTALEQVAAETLDAGAGYDWTDMSYQEKKAAGSSAVVFAFAILLVFLILAAQYESWSLPFSVLLGTPFAAFGAFLGLWLMRFVSESYVNNVFAQIGLVMLIGLAAKNAILIVEFARAKLHEGMPIVEAALEGAKLRFRPILMTAFAFILGVVPLVRASGAGAEGRKVMGMAVFAGMLVATIVGVVLIPVLFTFVEKITGGGRHKPAPPGGETKPAAAH